MRTHSSRLAARMQAAVLFSYIVLGSVASALPQFVPVAEAATQCNGLDATIVGTGAGETINGTAGDDIIVAKGGNDTINGNGGNDTICGGDGNDTITTGSGNDWIDGEKNDDSITDTGGTNTVSGDDGDDTINTGSGNDTINGGKNSDTIVDTGGTNTINGNDGNDTITTGDGNDTIDGGNNTDICSAGAGTNIVSNCESGNAVITIVKDAIPDDAQDFAFSGTLGSFSPLDDDADGTLSNSQTFTKAWGSTYTATEAATPGWTLTGLVCTGGGGNTSTVGATATIGLDAGEAVTCTFTNTKDIVCGDGSIEDAEQCDDGGTANGDGCSAACTVESGYSCDGEPSICAPVCGDSQIVGSETCDDGNDTEGDGCSAVCQTETVYSCPTPNQACIPICGDGLVKVGEACDDGNTETGDGCSAICAVEDGFACDGEPSTCTTTCGDGIPAGAEACDDGDDINDNGCTNACTLPVCSDGITQAGNNEECDDANLTNDDDCTNACKLPACGDGILQTGNDEQCDDGNTESGDGCSDTCTNELPQCNGQDANIYVNNGVVVGGPNDGLAYVAGTTVLKGTDDNDVIVGTDAGDKIEGKKGDDTICGRAGNDDIKGGEGDDTIYGEGDNDKAKGEKGADTIYGGDGDDQTLDGGDGNDTIYGGAGDDKLKGGKDDDTLYGNEGGDDLDGGDGADHLYGQAGLDTLKGGKQNDILCGHGEDDVLKGGDGDDSLDGGPETDTLNGDKGTDTCVNGESLSHCEVTTGSIPECGDSSSSSSESSSEDSSSSEGSSSSSSSTITTCTPTDESLVAYWKFDEGEGTSTADSTAHNNLGTLQGGAGWSSSTPPSSFFDVFSLDLDGVDDFVSVPDTTDLSFDTTPFSVTAWVYPEDLGTDRQIISKGYDGTNTEWELKTTSATGKVSFRSWNGSVIGVESLVPLTAQTWTHVAGVFDGANWKIYLDGAEDNSAAGPAPVLTDRPVDIGAVDNQGTPVQFWHGGLDDVRVYNRALSSQEIADLAYGMCTSESSSSSSSSEESSASSSEGSSSSSSEGEGEGSSSSQSSSSSLSGELTPLVPPPPPPGGGSHGHNLTSFSSVIHFVLANASGNGRVAPGAFGGQSNNVITPAQRDLLCIIQRSLAPKADSALIIWIAQYISPYFGLQEQVVAEALLDPGLCSRTSASMSQIRITSVKQILLVDSKGIPISSNPIWNACIRNTLSFSISDSRPLSCGRYHVGNFWTNPDSLVTFKWSNRFQNQLQPADADPLLVIQVN